MFKKHLNTFNRRFLNIYFFILIAILFNNIYHNLFLNKTNIINMLFYIFFITVFFNKIYNFDFKYK